jgi:hypothetical protein
MSQTKRPKPGTFGERSVTARKCRGCGQWFYPARVDKLACSAACRQQAARQAKRDASRDTAQARRRRSAAVKRAIESADEGVEARPIRSITVADLGDPGRNFVITLTPPEVKRLAAGSPLFLAVVYPGGDG